MHVNVLRFLAVFSVTLATISVSHAQTLLKVSAGTGFVINNQGNLVTNEHVVRQCQSINVLTPRGERGATLTAVDAQHDLAVLQVTDAGGASIAPLRWNISELEVGDLVYVIGFPGQAGLEGRYTAKKTAITSLKGPQNEPRWLQLQSVAQHGNSGGPVLDATGNVIAVVSGMAQTYKVTPDGRISPELVGQSDVAITLATLQDFLHQAGIPFYESLSRGAYGDSAIQNNALKFILPVRCIQGRITQ